MDLIMKRTAEDMRAALVVALNALENYADPESYRAMTISVDRPAGWFADDFSPTEHPHYTRKMPGAAARRALWRIKQLLPPDPNSLEWP